MPVCFEFQFHTVVNIFVSSNFLQDPVLSPEDLDRFSWANNRKPLNVLKKVKETDILLVIFDP